MNILLELLRSDGSIVVNKKLARAIGMTEAVIFSELLSKSEYFIKRNLLDEEGYFFCTAEDMELSTTYSKKQQTSAIKHLEELGLILYKVKGMPAKRYFMVTNNIETLTKILTENGGEKITTKGKTCSDKKEQQEVTKGHYKELQKGTTCSNKKEQHVVTKGNGNNTNNNTNNNTKDNFEDLINSYTENKKLKETLLDFFEYRKSIKKPLTELALTKLLNKLSEIGSSDLEKIEILNNSIINCWQGVFELDAKQKKGVIAKKVPSKEPVKLKFVDKGYL